MLRFHVSYHRRHQPGLKTRWMPARRMAKSDGEHGEQEQARGPARGVRVLRLWRGAR